MPAIIVNTSADIDPETKLVVAKRKTFVISLTFLELSQTCLTILAVGISLKDYLWETQFLLPELLRQNLRKTQNKMVLAYNLSFI